MTFTTKKRIKKQIKVDMNFSMVGVAMVWLLAVKELTDT